jgi:hypothetical protein
VLERRLESRSDTGTYLVEDELIARSLASARHRGVAASVAGLSTERYNLK